MVYETNKPVFDKSITDRIAQLRAQISRAEDLLNNHRKNLPADVAAEIGASANRDAKTLAKLESSDPIEHVIHGTTTTTTNTRTIYNKDLAPRIEELKARISVVEKLPILSAEEKTAQIASAELAQDQYGPSQCSIL